MRRSAWAVTAQSAERWDAIDRGIAFCHKKAPVIKSGISFRLGPKIKSARHPKGWQAVNRVGKDGEAATVYLAE